MRSPKGSNRTGGAGRHRPFELDFAETVPAGSTANTVEITAGNSLRLYLIPLHLQGILRVRSASIPARVDTAEPANTVVPFRMGIYRVRLSSLREGKPLSEPAPRWSAELMASFPSFEVARGTNPTRYDVFLNREIVLDPIIGRFFVGVIAKSSLGTCYLVSNEVSTFGSPNRARPCHEVAAAMVLPQTGHVLPTTGLVAPYVCLRSAIGATLYG